MQENHLVNASYDSFFGAQMRQIFAAKQDLGCFLQNLPFLRSFITTWVSQNK